jgi:hypothetical protein
MADLKISQLTGATTPLAGTEVVPVVQSGATKQVSVANLTAGRAVSAAQLDVDNIRVDGNTVSSTNTNGDINITPNGAGRVLLNATAIGGLFSSRFYFGAGAVGLWFDTSNNAIRPLNAGTPGLSNGNIDLGLSDSRFKDLHLAGNVIVASGKGIDFSATPGTGTSELFADYEEGTWTPTFASSSGSFTSITYDAAVTGAKYTKVGNVVHIQGSIRTSAITVGTASGNLLIAGLPFSAVANATGQDGTASGVIGQSSAWAVNMPSALSLSASQISLFHRLTSNGASALTQVTDAGTGSAANLIRFSCTYLTA